MKKLIIRSDKEKAIRNRHHWIFSGAVASLPKNASPGEIVAVESQKGELLGHAYVNLKSSLLGRMVSFGSEDPLVAIERAMDEAITFRATLFRDPSQTNAYRLVNGEGDRLPGLVVDRYGDSLVIQISTSGMDLLREWILEQLVKRLKPKGIYEKSSSLARREEGLPEIMTWRFGTHQQEIPILENGLQFFVDPEHGQKTGFFLDQREMRHLVSRLSTGKRVLNMFCYTGGFSLYAAKGGAAHVDSVDISEPAIAMLKKNVSLNGQENLHNAYCTDAFQYLREQSLDYDLVILDPPAFAKRRKDIVPACRGYKDINRLAMQKMPKKSLLLTNSCSYYVNEELFQKVVFQASIEAGRTARIIERHHLASDHPINLCHPEGDYLKSLLLYLE